MRYAEAQRAKKSRPWYQTAKVKTLMLSLPSCLTLGKILNFSRLQFLHLRNEG